ncbi:LysR substrate-binding domain-containing protein [Amycolatopsis sp. DG1A-15b]|uniref:LysR family transcriptional regulator n=1 Tax=Amycolatopsis sp. DG1A-15b TaxID=3052846 RepID=UPI00255BA5DD|nr:LysR substrate-binding domain-containing protein [Amycolatopsis sp. DG1A-15b]WIX93163.1 LysR substrate-binding domain-containing protein [Amycolatopsis sp. DG1A-15b]
MDVHVRDLRYFVAVAEELSFTRAAGRLFIAQPSLSKQIRRLETSLRIPLFERDHRTVVLTAAGAALLPQARLIIRQWEDARSALAEVAAAQRATLTVGFHTRIGRGLIPNVTAKMATSLPEWRLLFRQIAWSDPTVGLAGGEVDVAVAWLPVPDGFARKVVATEDRWIALPSGHRLAGREAVPLSELAGEPFIALPRTAGPLREFWLGNDRHPVPARVVAEAETAEESLEAVGSGLGVVLLSEGNAQIYERDDIVYRPVTGLPPGELAVVWRAGDERRAVRVFVEACERCLCAG